MTTAASPVAASMPASVAAGWPKRREKRSIFTRGSRSRSARIDVLGAVGARVHREDHLPVHADPGRGRPRRRS